jgi:long-chain acyl-CoA synthetase
LYGLFLRRLARTPKRRAYRYFDGQRWIDKTWEETAADVARWQSALRREGLTRGDRVAIMMRTRYEWMLFDQAALGLGLVTVPLHAVDNAENATYIMRNAGARFLLCEEQSKWQGFLDLGDEFKSLALSKVVVLDAQNDDLGLRYAVSAKSWLNVEVKPLEEKISDTAGSLATIMYTSGTMGKPKGVMLSHRNILENAYGGYRAVQIAIDENDLFLSFLPLSHVFERTVGYYLPIMTGAAVAYNRSVPQLVEDLMEQKPTALVCVPRIFERVHHAIQAQLQQSSPIRQKLFDLAVDVGWHRFLVSQKRAKPHPKQYLWPLLEKLVARKITSRMGGRLRLALSGSAPLAPEIAKMFVGLGIPLLQGYGLTEASPIIAVNRFNDNVPESVGLPIPDVSVKIGANQELLAKGPNVMIGYWNNPEATAKAIDDEGWLHTGDQAKMDEGGHLYIIGRLKEIIVLANGEKVPPADIEMAILADPLFEQVMLVGEGKPYLSALVVLNPEEWARFAKEKGLDARSKEIMHSEQVEHMLLERIARLIRHFPGYAKVYRLTVCDQPWGVDNALATPTMKVRRNQVLKHFEQEIAKMYEGH